MVHILEDCLDCNCLSHRDGGRIQRWFGDFGDSSGSILPSEELLGGIRCGLEGEHFPVVEFRLVAVDNGGSPDGVTGACTGDFWIVTD